MFNPNFYPTPKHVYNKMDVNPNGKTILEPHGGAGHLIDFLKDDGAKHILTCETDIKLAEIAMRKAHFLKPDFLDVVSLEISHIDIIVMNPPFDNADKHIIHAFDIAPPGCEIFALVNSETINNQFSKSRQRLATIIKDFGTSYSIGRAFSSAERMTNIDISVIKIIKPSEEQSEFGDFFSMDEDEAFGSESNGLIQFNEIRSIVQSYVQSIKDYRSFKVQATSLQNSLSRLNISAPIKVEITYDKGVTDEVSFTKEIQKKAWSFVFQKVKAEKYLTKGVKEDLNKFIEQNQQYPFTMKNIFAMLDVLMQTRSQTLNKALVEAVDHYTMYTSENRYNVEGWKTNSGHCLNEKFIVNRLANLKYKGGLEFTYYHDYMDRLNDLIKVICFITGTDYDSLTPITWASCPKPYVYSGQDAFWDSELKQYDFSKPRDFNSRPDGINRFEPNKRYSSHFFEFKMFKKQTVHFKFKDKKVWEALNRAYAKAKGQVLPEKL